jgi:hypothetical protein
MKVFDFLRPPNFKLLSSNFKKKETQQMIVIFWSSYCPLGAVVIITRSGLQKFLLCHCFILQLNLSILATFGCIQSRPTYTGLYRWSTYRNHVALWELNCANVQFIMTRQVVKLGSKYMTLSMNTDLKYCDESVATGNLQLLFVILEKDRRWLGKSFFFQWRSSP